MSYKLTTGGLCLIHSHHWRLTSYSHHWRLASLSPLEAYVLLSPLEACVPLYLQNTEKLYNVISLHHCRVVLCHKLTLEGCYIVKYHYGVFFFFLYSKLIIAMCVVL